MTESKAIGIIPISQKNGKMIAKAITKKPIEQAKKILQNAIDMKKAIPYPGLRSTPHKPGHMGAGRYPIESCKQIMILLKSAESNAQVKGMSSSLQVSKMIVCSAGRRMRYGRKSVQGKNARVELYLCEAEQKQKEAVKK